MLADGGGLRPGGQRGGRKRAPVPSASLSDSGEAEGAGLAILEAGYWTEIEGAVARDPKARVRLESAVLAKDQEFEGLLEECLAFSRKIMKMKIPKPEDKSFAVVLRMKKEITSAVLTTTARVREQMLRPDTNDGMEDVLAELARREEEAKLLS